MSAYPLHTFFVCSNICSFPIVRPLSAATFAYLIHQVLSFWQSAASPSSQTLFSSFFPDNYNGLSVIFRLLLVALVGLSLFWRHFSSFMWRLTLHQYLMYRPSHFFEASSANIASCLIEEMSDGRCIYHLQRPLDQWRWKRWAPG